MKTKPISEIKLLKLLGTILMFKWIFYACDHQAEQKHQNNCSLMLEKEKASISERYCLYFIFLFLQKQHFIYTQCEGI